MSKGKSIWGITRSVLLIFFETTKKEDVFIMTHPLFPVGADGFEPPKSKDSRFTVCPIWPLWKTPLF